jgi:hypothetical protein
VVVGSGQVAYTAGFLSEAAKDAALRVLHPMVKTGEAVVDAVQDVAAKVTDAGTAVQHKAASALHQVQDAAEGAAAAARHTISTAGHQGSHAAQSLMHGADKAAQGAHDSSSRGDDSTPKALPDNSHAWTGAYRSLHDRLGHVKCILKAVRKLPSLTPGSVLSSLQHHSQRSKKASGSSSTQGSPAGAGVGSTSSGSLGADSDVRAARAAHIQALHEGLESLQVSASEATPALMHTVIHNPVQPGHNGHLTLHGVGGCWMLHSTCCEWAPVWQIQPWSQ